MTCSETGEWAGGAGEEGKEQRAKLETGWDTACPWRLRSSRAGRLLVPLAWLKCPLLLETFLPSLPPHPLQASSPSLPLGLPYAPCLSWHLLPHWTPNLALGMPHLLSLAAHPTLPEGKDGPSSLSPAAGTGPGTC